MKTLIFKMDCYTNVVIRSRTSKRQSLDSQTSPHIYFAAQGKTMNRSLMVKRPNATVPSNQFRMSIIENNIFRLTRVGYHAQPGPFLNLTSNNETLLQQAGYYIEVAS